MTWLKVEKSKERLALNQEEVFEGDYFGVLCLMVKSSPCWSLSQQVFATDNYYNIYNVSFYWRLSKYSLQSDEFVCKESHVMEMRIKDELRQIFIRTYYCETECLLKT